MATTTKSKLLPFEDARDFARSLGLKNNMDWRLWCKSGKRPESIPSMPERAYKENWLSWGDWLGNARISNNKKQFLSFNDARKFVRDLGLKNQKEWRDWIKHGNRPHFIPSNPENQYQGEFISFGDWIGTEYIHKKQFRDFYYAREFARNLNLNTQKDWQAWAQSVNRPDDIPAIPSRAYKQEWTNWGDWLGTFRVASVNLEFLPFVEAREVVRKKKLKSQLEFKEWSKSGLMPEGVPASPQRVYANEFISWGDWLGVFSRWTQKTLLGFIKSIYPILPDLEPSELFAILRNNNCLNAIEQLGEDSPLKRLINDTLHGNLENLETDFAELSEYEAKTANEAVEIEDVKIEEAELTAEINPTESDIVEELPSLSANHIFENLDHLENVLGISDEETVEFLINKSLGRLWNRVLKSSDPDEEIRGIKNHKGATYSEKVKERYLEQYEGATSLPIPSGYTFKKNGELLKPNLMQRLVAYRLKTENRIGNWSGTGAGKTLGAILGSRVIDAKLTIIIGLNNTILDDKSGWAAEIKNAFAESNVLIKEKKNISFSTVKPNYLLLNYETFQLDNSKTVVDSILDTHKVDLIVLDEVHSAKSKDNQESKRRQLINYLLLKASEINPELRVLGMSATPVINSLDEAVSLIEMIKGREYNELDTAPKLSNALAIHEQLVINGIRYVPNYSMELKEREFEIVNNAIAEELKNIGKGQVLQIEVALLNAKIKSIIELCKPGTLIYSHFVDGMFDVLSDAIRASGMTVARFNGDDKTGLELFKQGKRDILLGSSAISTGVDGLQYVCNRLIIACLPWTSAGYEQLLGRIYRQGSKFNEVEVFIPQVTLTNEGDTWSWDKQRHARIKYKKTLADAAVDGQIPEANLMSPAAMLNESKAALDEWMKRLESGEIYELSRRELKIPLPPDQVEKSIRKYGDFSLMNQRFNTSKSTTMHDRLVNDPEEFYLYHSLYREARASWSEVPFVVISEQVNKRPDWVIGDFGCGEALLSKSIGNKVYSYDHVAINSSVIACDMADTGAESDILDVAVFSLSLMGVNWSDYIKEAFRMVKAGGLLKISEPASNWETDGFERLKKGIQDAGFELLGEPRLSSKFVYIDAVKPL